MRSNTVVLVNQVTGPLFIDIANEYVEKYGKVVLITGAIEATYAELDSRIDVVKKVRYKRNKSYLRIATWMLFYLQVYLHFLFKGKKYDKALLVTNPPLMPFIGSSLLPRIKVKFDVLVYDVYPDALSNLGYIKTESALFKYWDKKNKKSYENAQRVITISSVMKEVISRNVDEQKIEVIYPWVDTSFIKPLVKKENWFVKEHHLLDKKVVLYSGNMGATHDLLTPLKVAKNVQVSHPEYHFLYIGDGVQKSKLLEFADKNQLKNVSFLPYQDSETLPFSFASADFGIVSLGEGAEGLSVPSKTFYFLAAGAAIIAITGKGSEIHRLVVNNKCGVSIDTGNVEEMTQFLKNINSSNVAQYKKNSRELSKDFTVKNATEFVN